jgi:hypothetical protein
MRELDRERAKMEQQEKKIIMDIKKMAKQGQMDAVKVMAKVSLISETQCPQYSSTFIVTLKVFLGLSKNEKLCEKIHADENQHSSSVSKDSNS